MGDCLAPRLLRGVMTARDLALVLCMRDDVNRCGHELQEIGQRHQRAGIWSTNGKPIPALAPNGTGPLPWNKVTVDAEYTPNGKLMLLHGWQLTRLHG